MDPGHFRALFLPSLSLLLLINCPKLVFSVKYDFYERAPCMNAKAVTSAIQDKPASVEQTVLSCADSCTSDQRCRFAIFFDTSQTCYHFSKDDHVDATSLESSEEDNGEVNQPRCVILKKEEKPIECFNDGVPVGDNCNCLPSFAGRYCEEEIPQVCWKPKIWVELNTTEQYELFEASFIPMKVKRQRGTIAPTLTSITHIPFFKTSSRNGFLFRVQNYLTVDSTGQDFEFPLKREFQFYSGRSKMEEYLFPLGVGQSRESHRETDPVFQLLGPSVLDDMRLVYLEGQHGTVSDLVEKLSTGHRLMSREASRVGFDGQNDDVIVESVTSMWHTASRTPYYFVSRKEVLQSKTTYEMKTSIQTGEVYTTSSSGGLNKRWEVDRCWARIEPSEDYQEFTHALQIVLSQGREIRLVLNGHVASDVTVVRVTEIDVIAVLVDYLTPFDGVNPLNESSRIVSSHFSRSNSLVECEMKFQGNEVYARRTSSYKDGVEWFKSTRPFKEVVVVDHNGGTVSGSIEELGEAASSGRNVRICVITDQAENVCSGGVQILVDGDGHVTLQTPAFISMSDPPSCQYDVWLVSSRGGSRP